jgi:hypothetical protein
MPGAFGIEHFNPVAENIGGRINSAMLQQVM